MPAHRRGGRRIDSSWGNSFFTVRRMSFRTVLCDSSASTCRAEAYTLINASKTKYMKSG